MKKLIAGVLSLVLLFMTCTTSVADTTTSEDYIPSETETNVVTDEYGLVNYEEALDKAAQKMKEAHRDLDRVKGLEDEESLMIAEHAKFVYKYAHENYIRYASIIKGIKEAEAERLMLDKAAIYPVATEVWIFFRDHGYSDPVIAAIIGNFMAEVGGQTLNLRYKTDGKGYYGLAQWSKKYYPGVVGLDLQGQCQFVLDTIDRAFYYYGYQYKPGFTLSDFLAMTDEREAAYAFAEVYENCESASYAVRQSNATKALNFFAPADDD